MVYMDACAGDICVRVWVGFFSCCMSWFHGHMIPTDCGSDWPGPSVCSYFFFLKTRVVFRKQISVATLLSAHMREQVSALENAGKLYHV